MNSLKFLVAGSIVASFLAACSPMGVMPTSAPSVGANTTTTLSQVQPVSTTTVAVVTTSSSSSTTTTSTTTTIPPFYTLFQPPYVFDSENSSSTLSATSGSSPLPSGGTVGITTTSGSSGGCINFILPPGNIIVTGTLSGTLGVPAQLTYQGGFVLSTPKGTSFNVAMASPGPILQLQLSPGILGIPGVVTLSNLKFYIQSMVYPWIPNFQGNDPSATCTYNSAPPVGTASIVNTGSSNMPLILSFNGFPPNKTIEAKGTISESGHPLGFLRIDCPSGTSTYPPAITSSIPYDIIFNSGSSGGFLTISGSGQPGFGITVNNISFFSN